MNGYHNLTDDELHTEVQFSNCPLTQEVLNRWLEKRKDLEAIDNAGDLFTGDLTPVQKSEAICAIINNDWILVDTGLWHLEGFNEYRNIFKHKVEIEHIGSRIYQYRIQHGLLGKEEFTRGGFSSLKVAREAVTQKAIELVCADKLKG